MFALGTGLSVAGTAAGTISSAVNQNRMYTRTARSSLEAYLIDQKATQEGLVESQEAASMDVEKANIEIAQARAQASVSAAERGVSGPSVDLMIRDYDAIYARSVDTVNRNLRMQARQAQRAGAGSRATARNRITSAYPQYPSLVGTALQLGGSILSSANQFNMAIAPSGRGWYGDLYATRKTGVVP